MTKTFNKIHIVLFIFYTYLTAPSGDARERQKTEERETKKERSRVPWMCLCNLIFGPRASPKISNWGKCVIWDVSSFSLSLSLSLWLLTNEDKFGDESLAKIAVCWHVI